MMNLKMISIMLIMFTLVLTVPCIFAENPDTGDYNEISNGLMAIGYEDSIEIEEEIIGEYSSKSLLESPNANEIDSLSNLNSEIKQIKSGSVYNFTKDYRYGNSDSDFRKGIIIEANNVTLNGNGHIIDGDGKSAIFQVIGNNVRINNLTFINGGYTSQEIANGLKKSNGYSCINWQGSEGSLINCSFKNNAGLYGGAISWFGESGYLADSTFINNTASLVGGTFYIAGNNMSIINSTVLNSTTNLTGESIYVDHNISFSHSELKSNSLIPIIIANATKFNVEYLTYSYNLLVGDKTFDFIQPLYASVMWNLPYKIDNDLTFYCQYNNETKDFLVTFFRTFSNDFKYKKVLHFSNVQDTNGLFESLLANKFSNEITFIKSINVTNINDYEYACGYNRDDLLNEKYVEDIFDDFWDNPSDSIVFSLDVNFPKPISINSNKNWNTENKRLDVICINGNGSKIFKKNNKQDEYTWASLRQNCVFYVNDLTIQGFNTGLDIRGGCGILNNVTLDGNMKHYLCYLDWGGGILNAGYCVCNNCTFINNYAKHGGAIFNLDAIILNNCTFINNTAYGEGKDVCNADNGNVTIDDEEIKGSKGVVTSVKSFSSTERALLKIVTYIGSFTVGFIAGLLTANPFIGMAIGAGAGVLLGGISTYAILKYNYDINFNRFATALEIMGIAISSGIIGGTLGALFQYSIAPKLRIAFQGKVITANDLITAQKTTLEVIDTVPIGGATMTAPAGGMEASGFSDSLPAIIEG